VIVLTVATVLLVLIALAAVYFLARASAAIVAMRADAKALREQHTGAITMGREALKQTQRTQVQAQRVVDKVYRANQDTLQMLSDPTVQRALRQEGRR
jgi:hypothetical protein